MAAEEEEVKKRGTLADTADFRRGEGGSGVHPCDCVRVSQT